MLTIYYIGFEPDNGYIEVETAGNMLGTCMKSGRIAAQKAGKIAKDQGAVILINGVRFKRGLLDRLFGK